MRVEGLEKWEDRIKACELDNGNTQYFVEYHGTDFGIAIKLHADSEHEEKLEVYSQIDENFIKLFSRCIHSGRYRIWYGDRETGRSWNEEYDVIGEIGRTGGRFKVPILLHDKRSIGGGTILISCIIRIDDITSHRTLWKVSNFHVEKMYLETTGSENYPYAVMQLKDNGAVSNIANFKTKNQAKRWIDFMNGVSYRK